MGLLNELPLGFSFMSGLYKDAEITPMAYAYEQATKKRVMPKFIRSMVDE
ncbi:MAG: hypothetical protein ABI402_00125 [Ferruginibacter sp.]